MNYGFYAAFLGMRARQRTLDVIANNIANASTEGFKAERLHYRSVEAAEVSRIRAEEKGIALPAAQQGNAQNAQNPNPVNGQATATPVNAQSNAQSNSSTVPASSPQRIDRAFGVVTGSIKDLSGGSLRQTGNPLDVALQGDGYFAVQTPRGERYTRAGSFSIDSSGQLVTQRGELVIGQSGPITLAKGEVSIGQDGAITVNGNPVDQLKIVRFQNPQSALTREGDTLFAATGTEQPREATNISIAQGYVESSNVNTISEMAAMMQNSREFDSLERSIKLMMDIRKAASEIGRV